MDGWGVEGTYGGVLDGPLEFVDAFVGWYIFLRREANGRDEPTATILDIVGCLDHPLPLLLVKSGAFHGGVVFNVLAQL